MNEYRLKHGFITVLYLPYLQDWFRTMTERRFVIWGFSKAVRQMALDKEFRTAVYVLKYKGSIVEPLAFYPVGFPSLHGSFETADIAQVDALISPVNSGTNGSISIASAGELELRISLVRPDMLLDRYGYFVNVGSVLVTAAQYPNIARVFAQFFSLPRFHVSIIITDTLLNVEMAHQDDDAASIRRGATRNQACF